MHFYLRLLRGACVFCVPVLANKHILINQYPRLFFYYPPSLFFALEYTLPMLPSTPRGKGKKVYRRNHRLH